MNLVIEFGSKHHGCTDHYSDRDALLVYDSPDLVRAQRLELVRKGFSVTTLSYSAAHHLAKTGSLFARHVFFEGKPNEGHEAAIHNFKNAWTPSRRYAWEIESNMELLSVLDFTPASWESRATVVDILICSVRNVLIRKIAIRGDYYFSWPDIIGRSLRLGLIRKSDCRLILYARRLKNAYRARFIPKVSIPFLNALEDLCKRVIDPKRKIIRGTHREITSLPERYQEGSYAQLRAIELLCSHYSFDSSMARYTATTKDPNYFCRFGVSHAMARHLILTETRLDSPQSMYDR